jgi:fumarylacetoacetase
LDIDLQIHLRGAGDAEPTLISSTNFSQMYWNVCQQLAHLTSNGANVLPGDLCASGTVSGPTPDSYGSMLELCWKGTKPLTLVGGGQRKFLADGDEVTISGYCRAEEFRIGFGEVVGKVIASRS